MKHLALLFFLFTFVSTRIPAQTVGLKNAHAHNDYEHARPLLDALSHGFTSIEADVYLINQQLYVSHDRPKNLNENRTLQALYLDPLKEQIKKNKGSIYPGHHEPIYLMIDIKTEAEATYQLLKQQLEPYKDILYTTANKDGSVQIVLSGNRPIESAVKDPDQLVSIDGRPSDLAKNYDANFMPVISQNYNQVVQWKGDGKISAADFSTLKQLAETAHRQGKKLRLWATPENEEVWKTLLEAGVDFINTDQLQRLHHFLLNRK